MTTSRGAMDAPFRAALCLLLICGAWIDAQAQGDLPLPVPVGQFPNFVALSAGGAPDYLGSDDYFFGGAPAVRWDLGPASLNVLGNWAMIDLTPARGLRLGPAGVLRFGRRNVDDPVVDRTASIAHTVELGMSVGYELVDPTHPLKRLAVGADVLFDVGGVHRGTVFSLYGRGTWPLGWPGGGLPEYRARGGMRDVRIGAGLIQSLSPSWHIGVGGLYTRLLADAARSPLVRDRGSANQGILGVGLIYAWGFRGAADDVE